MKTSQSNNLTPTTVNGCVGHKKNSEAHRAKCEAKYWLKVTKGDPVSVDSVLARIAEKRSNAVANELRDLMRAEWKKSR